jgi:hypothetical protein
MPSSTHDMDVELYILRDDEWIAAVFLNGVGLGVSMTTVRSEVA